MRSGSAYRAALEDGRVVWHDGKRVPSVLDDAAFRPTIDTICELMDQHPSSDELSFSENGRRVAVSATLPRHADDLRRMGNVATLFAERTLGSMGRLWDTSGGLICGLRNLAKEIGRRRPSARLLVERLYDDARENLLLVAVAFADGPVVRDTERGTGGGILRVVERTDRGAFVSGVKTVSTGAPYADELLVLRIARPNLPSTREELVGFLLPPATEGLSIVSRPSLHNESSSLAGLDEMDAALVFDRVFVPHERFLYDADMELADLIWTSVEFWDKHCFVRRIAAKLEILHGLGMLMAETFNVRSNAAAAGLLSVGRHAAIVRRLIDAAENAPEGAPGSGGAVVPEQLGLQLALHLGTDQMTHILEQVSFLAPQPLVMTPRVSELASAARPLYDTIYADQTDERVELANLAADMVSSRFSTRQRLLDRNAAGGLPRLLHQIQASLDQGHGLAVVREFLRRRRSTSPAEVKAVSP